MSAQNWTTAEIDAWSRDLDNQADWAYSMGDETCGEILGAAAAAGYSNPKLTGVMWNSQLIAATGWNGVTWTHWNGDIDIEIDPGSDNVKRTIIHEGMHASKWYSGNEVHNMQSDIQGCAADYPPPAS